MKIFHENSQKGFALIAAILALMILLAVGVLVFTVTNQDIRISSRIVGEKKAFMSAEAGIHNLMQGFAPDDLSASVKTDYLVDPNDATSKFSVTAPQAPTSGPAAVRIPGYNIAGEDYGLLRFVTTVTGENTAYNSQVQIDVGVGYGPVNLTTIYR
jgi:Tfp pilus assembly protein PilX